MTDKRPAINSTYLLAEDAYRYGLGPLLVRITKVLEPTEFGDGELWWLVEAICKHPQADRTPPRRWSRLARKQRR